MALVARGRPDDLRRAKILADAFVYAQDHDRHFTDGRLRNAYACGELPNAAEGGAARLPGWWDEEAKSWYEDKYFASTDCGNMAWVMTGLLNYWDKADRHLDSPYLKSAVRLGKWIVATSFSPGEPGGFSGGVEGWEKTNRNPAGQQQVTWKSTEHNIDLLVAFARLHRATGDVSWQCHSDHARQFIDRMFSGVEKHLWTGTDLDGRTINRANVPLDIQPWALLALRDAKRYEPAIDWAVANCKVAACPKGCRTHGFDFNTDRDGVWWEGTAQMGLALRLLGRRTEAEGCLSALRGSVACEPAQPEAFSPVVTMA